MRLPRIAALSLLVSCGAWSQQYVVTTIAGGQPTRSPSLAANSSIGLVQSVAEDAAGNVYSTGLNCVFKIDPSGTLTVVAGNARAGYSNDGQAAVSAQLNSPSAVAVDSAGNVYVADTGNNRIRKVTPGGTISTLAGSSGAGFSGDGGAATSAQMNAPAGVAADSKGNIYISDTANHRIRQVAPNGTITTIAGTGVAGFSGDGGAAAGARLNAPTAIALDAAGNLYVTDSANSRIRKVSPSGIISTIAGGGIGNPASGGVATSVQLISPAGVAVDSSGNVYFADSAVNRAWKVSSSGNISSLAGDGTANYSGDGGPAVSAELNQSRGMAVDGAGNLYIADYGNFRIRQISTSGSISTFAGNGSYAFSGDNGPASSAQVGGPADLAMDAAGNLYIADYLNNRIRKISASGVISTVAGNGSHGFSGDGSAAVNATLSNPRNVAVDGAGNLYIADQGNARIRKVAGGIITTVAGGGTATGDGGPATSAKLISPFGVTADAAGNLYFTDQGSNTIRRVSSGVISTIAGGGAASPGDGGPATSAKLNAPTGIAIRSDGSIFFTDYGNQRVRQILPGGTLTTLAGNGTAGDTGDGGPAANAQVNGPTGVVLDAAGNLYFTEYLGERVRKISTTGNISTIAGTGVLAYAGDGGLALSAQFYGPSAVAVDSAGRIYVTDSGNDAVRMLQVFVLPSLSVAPTSLSFTAVEGTNPPSQQFTLTGTAGAMWQASVFTESGGAWLSASPGAGTIPAPLQVSVTSASLTAGTYQGTVTIQIPGPETVSVLAQIQLTVTAAPPGQLTVAPNALSVQTAPGSSSASQTITIGNSGGGTLSWSAAASTVNGGDWLSVGPASGSAGLHTPSALQVSFNLDGLTPGVYTGSIKINSGAISIPVQLLVPPNAPAMVIGQSGVVLTAIAGGTAPAQNVIVANAGSGTMNWTAGLIRGSGISIAQGSGSSEAGLPNIPTFTVKGNSAGLNPGTYYGLIQVASTGAVNAPQIVDVVFNVLPSGKTAPIQVFPQALTFAASPIGTPASQTLSLATASSTGVSVSVTVATQSGGNWLNASAASVSLAPTGSLVFNASTAGLAPGLYTATITLVPSDGSSSEDISAILVVTPGSNIGSATTAAFHGSPASGCTPTKLLLAMRQLSSSFSSPVGWPVNLEAQVLDDCGNAVLNATTLASFSNGDPSLALPSLGNGIYSATWKPANNAATLVTVRASQGSLTPASLTVSGQVGITTVPPPSVGSGGVVNAASFAGADLAPGTIVSVFGANLASSDGKLAGFPLPTSLGNVKLTIGGIDAPLFYAGTGQVNAQIPFELSPGSRSQVVARAATTSGGELDAVPEPIVIGAAHPGIFIATGTQGAILNVSNQVVNSASPATAGDTIVIFCTGLGAVTPAASTGQPPASGTAVVRPVVTIGGMTAGLQYAGVAPGYVGLYQVNVTVPGGVAPGGSVAVVITQGGVASNIATIAVR